jgi:hypothetical protein
MTNDYTITINITEQEKELLDKATKHFTLREITLAGAKYLLDMHRMTEVFRRDYPDQPWYKYRQSKPDLP